jgi:precorrin-2/cobalt-factor-2 C20-methyltransferase
MTATHAQGRLFLVGVGPGDPELMTVKAVRVLEQAPVWITPKARENGASHALHIAAAHVGTENKEVLELRFPMKKIRLGEQVDGEVARAWSAAAGAVRTHLEQGRDVAFPTLGDPALYSTAFYLLDTLQGQNPDLQVTIVPGITAMSACSARIRAPLGLGDDVVTIVPAAFDDHRLRGILTANDAVILMKVFRRMDRLVPLLDELGLLAHAVLIERCGMDDQRIYTDLRQAQGRRLHYFSTILIRRKPVAARTA